MSECCCPAPDAVGGRPACTACATTGVLVDLPTVKSLLTESALARLNSAVFYFFCADANCPTVYFSADGRRFVTADIRVRVWQKEPSGDRTICYCFGENERDIRAEIVRDGASGAVNRVREHIAAHRCACDVRNPRGACCLGDVAAAVKRAQLVGQDA